MGYYDYLQKINQGSGNESQISLANGVHFKTENGRWSIILKVGKKNVHWYYPDAFKKYPYHSEEKLPIAEFLDSFKENKFNLMFRCVDFVPVYIGMRFKHVKREYNGYTHDKGHCYIEFDRTSIVTKLFSNTTQCPACKDIIINRTLYYEDGSVEKLESIFNNFNTAYCQNSESDQFGNIIGATLL